MSKHVDKVKLEGEWYATPADFGRLVGRARSTIFRAIKVGLLKDSLKDHEGRTLIAIDRGIVEYSQKADPKKVMRETRADKEGKVDFVGGRRDDRDTKGGVTLTDINKRKAALETAMAEMKLKERRGELIDAEGVKKAAFETASRVRSAVLNIPSRISAELAACTEQFQVEKILEDELRTALRELSE